MKTALGPNRARVYEKVDGGELEKTIGGARGRGWSWVLAEESGVGAGGRRARGGPRSEGGPWTMKTTTKMTRVVGAVDRGQSLRV